MKKVIIKNPENQKVYLDEIDENTPIFVKENDKLIGMVIKEKNGWILKLGGSTGAYGWTESLKECLEQGLGFNFEFYIEE